MIKRFLKGAVYGVTMLAIGGATLGGAAISFYWLVGAFGGWGVLAFVALIAAMIGGVSALPETKRECACDMGCKQCTGVDI